MSTPTLETRIDRLESRFAISELITDYAVACDTHDMPLLLDLFTEDASFDSPSGFMVAQSRARIEAMFIEIFKVRGPGYHWTHDHTVHFDEGNPHHATGRVLSHAETCPSGVASLAAMRYQDSYRREQGRWRFARRCIEFLYYVPVSEYANALSTTLRLVAGERRLAADYPETLEAWRSFHAQHGGPHLGGAAGKSA